jgi:hypothetical protein
LTLTVKNIHFEYQVSEMMNDDESPESYSTLTQSVKGSNETEVAGDDDDVAEAFHNRNSEHIHMP